MKSVASKGKSFSVHPALIYSIITKQASGIHKALLELAMNSVDAGASEIHLDITNEGFVFRDNGRGFKDVAQITSCFETFGTPHEHVDAEYGRYRLGRAQILSYSKTLWHTKNICMQVDLKDALKENDQHVPLGYTLSTSTEYFNGCKITGEFYEKNEIGDISQIAKISDDVEPQSIGYVIPAFAKMVKYLPVDIFINSVKVNKKTEAIMALEQTDGAIYALEQRYKAGQQIARTKGIINVYNKGVYAYQLKSKYHAGDVISIQNIDLNIARNSAKTTCPVSKSILKKISYIDQRVDIDYIKRREGNAVDQEINIAKFVERFWKGLLGFTSFDMHDFKQMFNQKVFKLGNDTKISFSDIFLHLETRRKKLAQQVNTPNFQLYFYSDDVIEKVIPNQRDKLTIKNGVIPAALFPDSTFIKSLNHKAGIPTSMIDDWVLKSLNKYERNCNIIRYRENQLYDISTDFSIVDLDSKNQIGEIYSLLLNHLLIVMSVYEKLSSNHYHMKFYNESSNVFLNTNPNPITLFFKKPVIALEIINISKFITDIPVKKARLTPYEKLVNNALNVVVGYTCIRQVTEKCSNLTNEDNPLRKSRNLRVEVLKSEYDDVLAWTNGYDLIAFDEDYFKQCAQSGDFSSLILTLIHEICHESNSAETLTHGASFFFVFKTMIDHVFSTLLFDFLDSLTRTVLRKCKSLEDIKALGIPDEVLKYLLQRQLDKMVARAG